MLGDTTAEARRDAARRHQTPTAATADADRIGGSVTALPVRHPSTLPAPSPARGTLAPRLGDIGTGAVAAAAFAQVTGVILRALTRDGTAPAGAGDALLLAGVLVLVLGAGALIAARGVVRRALTGVAVIAALAVGVLAVAGVVLALDDRGDPDGDPPSLAPVASVPTAGPATTATPTTAAATATTADPAVSPGEAIAAQGLGGGTGRTPTLPPGVTFPNGDSSRRGSAASPWGGQTLTPAGADGASGGSPDGSTDTTHGGH